MKATYRGVLLISKSYPLRTGEWVPVLRIIQWSKIRGEYITQTFSSESLVESESHAHQSSIAWGRSWINSH
jgi:hypothetical protein